MACCPVRSVDVDSAPRTCWRALEWAPRFWGSGRAHRICCWRFRLWSVSIWPCGSGTRFWPGPRWVWAHARSASARWGTDTSYSETPSRAPAAARLWKQSVFCGSSPQSRPAVTRPVSRLSVCLSGTPRRRCSRRKSFRSRCRPSCPPGHCTRPPLLSGPVSRHLNCRVWFRLRRMEIKILSTGKYHEQIRCFSEMLNISRSLTEIDCR